MDCATKETAIGTQTLEQGLLKIHNKATDTLKTKIEKEGQMAMLSLETEDSR